MITKGIDDIMKQAYLKTYQVDKIDEAKALLRDVANFQDTKVRRLAMKSCYAPRDLDWNMTTLFSIENLKNCR